MMCQKLSSNSASASFFARGPQEQKKMLDKTKTTTKFRKSRLLSLKDPALPFPLPAVVGYVAPLQGAEFGGAFTQGGAHGGVGRGDLAYKSDESDETDISIGRIGRIGHIDQKWRGRSAGILAGIQPTKIKTNQRLKPTTGKQAP